MIENPFGISDNTFSNYTFYNATLYVPVGTIDKYKSTEGWKDFVNIKEITATDAKQLKAMPVLIQAADGQISVEGAPEGTKVAVYDASGVEMGTAISRGGTTLIPTHIAKGSIAIVKIGEKVVKVKVKRE